MATGSCLVSLAQLGKKIMKKEHTRPKAHDLPQGPLMLTASGVAKLLNCSTRSVYRLADTGGIPMPVRIGGMIRWSRNTIEQWIAQGCPESP